MLIFQPFPLRISQILMLRFPEVGADADISNYPLDPGFDFDLKHDDLRIS